VKVGRIPILAVKGLEVTYRKIECLSPRSSSPNIMPPIHLIILGNALPEPGNLDGASRICLEVMSRWARSGKIRATIITSAKRAETCRAVGFPAETQYVLWPDCPGVWTVPGHQFAAIKVRRCASRMALPEGNERTTIYSASDFYPDVWSAEVLKKRMPEASWIASRFLFVPNPFKGWKNAYDSKLRLPDLPLLLGAIYQKISFYTILKADGWLITNEVDKAYFPKRIDTATRVKAAYGGVHFREIHETPMQVPKYAGVFCGRISPQKGVLDLVEIWRKVCDQKPDAKLALIGNGHKPFEDELKAKIQQLKLGSNVDWLGFMDGPKKHAIYKQSRVFLHTSVYDNYGMAACEAMAAGVPAIMYDLPPLRVAYPSGVRKAKLNDQNEFAQIVLDLNRDDAEYAVFSAEATAWAETQDWDNKAEELWEFFWGLLPSPLGESGWG
jgi:glycosyltransferase involved in cell wall biosynthesis